MTHPSLDLEAIDFEKGSGLVTVIAQDSATGEVLMVAHADREALERTIQSGEMHYRSRTRGPWHKGATSGNVQRVVSLALDCDGDAVLARVVSAGPACHTGRRSCFDSVADARPVGSLPDIDVLTRLDATIASRAAGSGGAASYTTKLLADRNLRLKKIGEEAAELAVAAADGDRARAIAEGADLFYHMLVALRAVGAGLDDVRAELAKREGTSSRA
jgi:phosphoribosyl-AMP cyclohydrolase / phosphoribosyl-ATP pyrophosphohydrolase